MKFKITDVYKRKFMRFRSSVSKIYVKLKIEEIIVNSILNWLHSVDLDKVIEILVSACNSESWAVLHISIWENHPKELKQLTRVIA
jgi:hypothetical protein